MSPPIALSKAQLEILGVSDQEVQLCRRLGVAVDTYAATKHRAKLSAGGGDGSVVGEHQLKLSSPAAKKILAGFTPEQLAQCAKEKIDPAVYAGILARLRVR